MAFDSVEMCRKMQITHELNFMHFVVAVCFATFATSQCDSNFEFRIRIWKLSILSEFNNNIRANCFFFFFFFKKPNLSIIRLCIRSAGEHLHG